MSARSPSLARRLFLQLSVVLAAAGVAMMALSAVVMSREINRTADRDLAIATEGLFVLMNEEIQNHENGVETGALLSREDSEAIQTIAEWREFAIVREGVVIFTSSPMIAAQGLRMTTGFGELDVGGEAWRSYSRQIPRYGLVIVVGEPLAVRSDALWRILSRLVIPFAALLVTAWVLLWLTLRGGLADLRRLSDALAWRSPQDLQPLDAQAWPRELHGPTEALNRLFNRVRQAFEHEQMFTATAAHQLRTPLATMRLQVQLLAKAAPPAFRDEMAELLASVDRAASSVEQMLRLARLEATSLTWAEIDLRVVLGDVIGEHLPSATRVGLEISLEVANDVPPILTDGEVLRLALGNLLENAVRHAASGGEAVVAVRRAADAVVIEVLDRGPGVTPALREQALEAYATLGSRTGRSGLGLAIVTRAARILGATFALDGRTDGPGLIARLSLPVTPGPR